MLTGNTSLTTCCATLAVLPLQGVRSTILPDSFDPAAAAAAAKSAAAAAAAVDEDAGSVVCHSIGSFSSSTSGSTISDADAADTAAAANGDAAVNGISSRANGSHHHKHHSNSSSGSGLTAVALAAHASSAAPSSSKDGAGAQHQQAPAATGLGSSAVFNGSAVNLSSSDAAGGRRTGKGISVVKQLWAPHISTVSRASWLCYCCMVQAKSAQP
jgi:hypothetical protein